MTVIQASFRWKLDPQLLRDHCYNGSMAGAKQVAGIWMIPKDAHRPPRWSDAPQVKADGRRPGEILL